jgi:hypothetical protein
MQAAVAERQSALALLFPLEARWASNDKVTSCRKPTARERVRRGGNLGTSGLVWHSQAIGLVVADRDPPSPLAAGFVKSCRQLKLKNCLDAGHVSH